MRNWRADEGNAENKVGMRGIRWESESEESVWVCGESGWKCKKSEKSGSGCRELRWKVWR